MACHICGSNRHKMRNCPSAERYEQNCRQGIRRGDPQKCYTCGSFLHKQRDCSQYKEEQRKIEEEKQHHFDLHTLSSFCTQRKLQNLDEVRAFLEEGDRL